MINIIVASHGDLADKLKEVLEMILGRQECLVSISIKPNEGASDIISKIEKVLEEQEDGNGTLVLSDMFGGSVANVCLKVGRDKKMEIVCGVNLPMIIEAVTHRESDDLVSLASRVAEVGRKSIVNCREVFESRQSK
jgi:PTS system mannose-specific IIA component